MTSLEVRDPRLSAVVGRDVTFEKMADGCLFTEGPLWHPRGRYLLWSDMADGLTILLAEQNVDFSLNLADRVYVLEKGHIRYEGSSGEFRENESIRQQYLAL